MNKGYRKKALAGLAGLLISAGVSAQNVEVDVNLNIKHSVNGVSDFGRERHIGIHSALTETDWQGEQDKLDYLMNDLDVYMGRDNGSATWKFASTPEDPSRANHPAIDSMALFGEWLKGQYDSLPATVLQYESRSANMIMGTNAHPTYPTLSWYPNGLTWTDPQWQPKNIETSTEWVVEYLDKFFAKNPGDDGEPLPKYWEVINEPDMEYMTGAFMVTSQEDIWEYHNLVAKGLKERLGNKAPLVGGMTWGLHDLFAGDGLSRHQPDYLDQWITDPDAAAFYRNAAATQWPGNNTQSWYQWDVMWKGFMDAAGDNMDFYSLHFYDWPTYEAPGGALRSGGHTEATLEMVEWYDVQKNGINNRKPMVISEYGAVQGAWEYTEHQKRYDWECIKPFSSMLMQFLERPDYIELTLPFVPVKAEWGNTDSNGDGVPEYFYQYTLMRDDDRDGVWEFSDYVKWFELWSEVDGTRVDTKSSDPDIQVDAYVKGNEVFLILNNLESTATNIDLNFFEDYNNNVQSVNIKHLYLSGTQTVMLDNSTTNAAPNAITLEGDGTMILKYTYGTSVNIDQTSTEKKYYGESLSGTVPNRVTIGNGYVTSKVNGVSVPADPNKAEAMLKVTVSLFSDDDDKVGHLSIDKLLVNGVEVETPLDWRGANQLRSRHFGTLEIPIPAELLQTNNTFDIDFHHVGEVAVVNLLVWEFTKAPGRSDEGNPIEVVDVTGVSLTPATAALAPGESVTLTPTVAPANATNKSVTWSTSNANVATVNNGVVTAVGNGSAVITVATNDGNYTAATTVDVSSQVIAVGGVSVNPTSLSLRAGQSSDLTETIAPANASNKAVTWSSSNTSIATVNANGMVTAVAEGSATITVTTTDGNFTASTAVSVTPPITGGTEIIIEAEDYTTTSGTMDDAAYGGSGLGFNKAGTAVNYVNSGDYAEYTIAATEAGEYTITYHIATPSANAQIQILVDGVVATTDDIAVTGGWDTYATVAAASNATLSAGNHNITIKASGSNAWQWNLDKVVLNKIEGTPCVVTAVSVNTTSLSLTAGENESVTATVNATGSCTNGITWSSSNTAVATVDANGNIAAIAQGSATITATSSDDASVTASIAVSVSPISVGTSFTLEAETFTATNGTINDAAYGGSGLGFNNAGTTVNYVNSGDYADYTINVANAGNYAIEYMISTPMANAQIQLIIDGTVVTTDNVPNNGSWDNYTAFEAGNTVFLSAGTHTVRMTASGSNAWQWNLDKVNFNAIYGNARRANFNAATPLVQEVKIYPVPANNILKINGINDLEYRVAIFDYKGTQVLDKLIIPSESVELNVSNLENGLYLLRVYSSEKVHNLKLIIQH